MRQKKTGKTVRIPESSIPLLKDLRAKMEQTISVCGVRVVAVTRPSDGVVLACALSLALDAVKTPEK